MRELKSVVLIVLILTSTLRADEPAVLVPLVKNKFIYSNPKQIKIYIEDRLTSEIEQLNKDKKKLRGRARKWVVIRSKRLKRELTVFRKKGIFPTSIRKHITKPGVGYVNQSKNNHWVRVIEVLNKREFIGTVGYLRETIKIVGIVIIPGRPQTIYGRVEFHFRGFDTSKIEEDKRYGLSGFFKTTVKLVEPFVPDATNSPQGKQPKRKKTKRGRGKGKGKR